MWPQWSSFEDKKTHRTLNTQNMTNPTIESPVKMEYGRNFSISGLKMMVKSGLEKNILEIPTCASHFLFNEFTS